MPEEKDVMSREQRLFDLVRYARHYLHNEGLITNEEFTEILTDGSVGGKYAGSVDRLQSYDALRAQLSSALEAQRKAEGERDEAVRAMDDGIRQNAMQVDRLIGERDAARAQLQHITDAARNAIVSTPGAECLGPYEDSTGAFNALKAWHGLTEWLKTELAAARAEADQLRAKLDALLAVWNKLTAEPHPWWLEHIPSVLFEVIESLANQELRSIGMEYKRRFEDLDALATKAGHSVTYGKDGRVALDGRTIEEVVESEKHPALEELGPVI